MPTFTPPRTVQTARTLPNDPDPFNRMARHFDSGYRQVEWVLKENGTYVSVASPDLNRIAAAQEVYIGAHTYTVTQQQADDLIAAGFGAGVTP